MKKKLATPVLVDGGNAFDREAKTKAELTYRELEKADATNELDISYN